MKSFFFFLLTSLACNSFASTCIGSEETAFMALRLGKDDVIFFDDSISFNCNECSAALMDVAQAADGIVSSHMIPNLLEDLANRCQAECCHGFYPESHSVEVVELESLPFVTSDVEVGASEGFCQWEFITKPALNVCSLSEDSISHPLGHLLMSMEELLGLSNAQPAFENISKAFTFVNESSITLDDEEVIVAGETKKERFLRHFRAALLVGILGFLCLFYLSVISIVIYVWGNDSFDELIQHLRAEKEVNNILKSISESKKTEESASQTIEDDFATPLEVCSSETDVTFDDISHSCA